ncbi:DMT family transporter [Siminovitchia sediminis]|uniref:DMT family transporter n=1 Tax=Siminovitchia sediminis TaxID=1274353 RepID=A0ABW4KJ56_9BACI
MAWFALILAGCFECAAVAGITKVNQKITVASLTLLIGGFTLSFLLLSLAMRDISMGTAYAVWTGIGTVGGTVIGILFYGESKSKLRVFFIGLIIVSAIGLRLVSY